MSAGRPDANPRFPVVASASSLWPARAWAFLMLAFGFVPLANWIAGGHAAPWYANSLSEWASGSAIALGIAVVAFVILRRLDIWPAGWMGRLTSLSDRHDLTTSLALAVVASLVYGVVAVTVLSARPLLIDEIVQVMQARIFAEGRLARVADEFPAFFSALHVVDMNGRVFSQFPPGGPLLLLPGVLLGAPWVTGPFFGGVAVFAFHRVLRHTEASTGVALAGALVFALNPFMVFMAASHMNHVPTLALACLALWGLTTLVSTEARPRTAFVTGACLGLMMSIRPVDGAAFALPAGLWLLWRVIQGRTCITALVAAGVGMAVPLAGVLAYNRATTGAAMLFGYELLWGPSHGLGFHRAPWGVTHTPARGLELINLYFLRLQTYLFETPVPSLVPAGVALLVARRLSAIDRYLLASGSLLVLGYFAYWHDGFFLGPRFVYLLLPLLCVWTVRLPTLVVRGAESRWGARRFVVLVYASAAVVGLVATLPVRVRQYAGGLSSMRHDYLEPARREGVVDGLILVRESWGAQLIARLWALGVSRSEAESIYRTIDTCQLEGEVSSLESGGIRGREAAARLTALTGDSLRLVASTLSPDKTERVMPNATYSPRCARRLLEDGAGYSFLGPLLARGGGTNVYARDLHAADTLLLRRYPTHPVYLLRAASSAVGAPLVLERLNLDSARAEWSGQARTAR